MEERIEARWPPILAMLLAVGLAMALPDRYHFLEPWIPWTACVLCIASMIAVAVAPGQLLLRRIEQIAVIGTAVVISIINCLCIYRLASDMLAAKHGYGSLALLETAVVLWTVNMLAFALLYWQINRHSDFSFAEAEHPMAEGWQPRFIDYLFLAFATSATFNPPDHSRPTSHRAKILLMLQASISLIALFLIAARAIGTLS
jgi:hypothetical protein